jgi:cytochrome c-type biogenesis protein CcmH
MTLWIVLTSMIALAACGLTIPLVRRHDLARARGGNVEVLRSQLADIDAQLASGAIAQADAEGLRTEIKRRLLAEGRAADAPARPIPANSMPWIAIGLSAVVALAATGLYATMGRPELTDSAAAPPPPPQQTAAAPAHPIGDVSTMVAQLEAQLQQSPGNAEGWRMLGWSYMHLKRPADAAKAYAKAAALAPGNGDYLSAEGEAQTLAAGGQVNGDALRTFKAALAAAPDDPRARYYLGVAKDQSGDHKGAMEDWIALLKSAPADAPWAAEVRGFVERTARERGDDISNRLPPAPAATPPGPSPAEVAAVSKMSPGEQQAMIRGMVDKLAGELKQNPRDADGWIRLMRARMVMGETDKAAEALRDATKAFADAPQQQTQLRDAARGLGVPGA